MELFAEIVNSFQLLTVYSINFILDVQMGSEYVYDSLSCSTCPTAIKYKDVKPNHKKEDRTGN